MSRLLITDAVERVTLRYLKEGVESPYEIDNGCCHDFADDVERELPDVGLTVLSDDVFMAQCDEEFAQLNWTGELHVSRYGTWSIDMLDWYGYPNIPINEVKRLPPHSWIYFDGFHYDAETPKGVESWTSLPIFKMWFGRHSKRRPFRKSLTLLEDGERHFLNSIRNSSNIPVLGDLARVEVGVTTGSNSYFTVPRSIVREYDLHHYAKPMVGRSVQVNSVVFKDSDWERNRDAEARAHLLVFPSRERLDAKNGAVRYVKYGESIGVHKGYKTGIRDDWFVVPSLKISDALFIRRNNLYPKLIINEAGAYTTDTMHRVFVKEGTDLNSFVASYYNSLSLAFTEVCGRSHGGGVLELMPNEAEQVLLPYHPENGKLLAEIDRLIRSGVGIEKVLSITNKVILKERFGLSDSEISIADSIWKKLSSRRLNRGK
jgi:adenine-specific DNA methylase